MDDATIIRQNINSTKTAGAQVPSFQFSVLTCKKIATKTIHADWKEIPFGNGKYFQFKYCEIPSLEGFAEALIWLADQPRKFIIRGQLKAGLNTAGWHRRLLNENNDDPATVECPARRWIALDLDGVEVSGGLDAPGVVAEAGYYICDHLLPQIFQQIKCVASATSSTGRRPGRVRLRLFFVMSDPTTNDALNAWIDSIAHEHPHLKLDPSVMRAQQPIYTARPLFIGCSDPVPPTRRVVVLDGTAEQISTSWAEIKEPEPKKPFKAKSYAGEVNGPEAWKVIRWVFELLDGCPKGADGRHVTLNKVAWGIANSVKEGKISKELARDAFLDAAKGIQNYDKRYDDKAIKDHLEWAFDRVSKQ